RQSRPLWTGSWPHCARPTCPSTRRPGCARASVCCTRRPASARAARLLARRAVRRARARSARDGHHGGVPLHGRRRAAERHPHEQQPRPQAPRVGAGGRRGAPEAAAPRPPRGARHRGRRRAARAHGGVPAGREVRARAVFPGARGRFPHGPGVAVELPAQGHVACLPQRRRRGRRN
ncbi:unnamed protein product, partial [Prorocentrum cordatum]